MNVDYCSNPLCVPVLLPQSILLKYFLELCRLHLQNRRKRSDAMNQIFTSLTGEMSVVRPFSSF